MTMCSMQWSLRDFFFFSSRRRHTRFDCDWSSDVCSSDLTLLFGATVLGVTYLLDRRTDQDYAFWLYLLGLVAFWGALTYDGVGSITYCLINLGLMLVAAAAAEDLHGVRGDRRVLLPRSPGVLRVQELPALPGGADRAGHRDHRGRPGGPRPPSRGGVRRGH